MYYQLAEMRSQMFGILQKNTETQKEEKDEKDKEAAKPVLNAAAKN